MIKKIIVSFLMVVAVICGINFGIANTTTNTVYAAESDATQVATLTSTSEKLATYSMQDNLPSTGYPENTVMEIKDGDVTIGTITVDKAAAKNNYVGGPHEIAKGSTFTLVPSNGYSIKRVLLVMPSINYITFTIDGDQGTSISLGKADQATKDMLTQAGLKPANAIGVELNPNYVATEQSPYSFITPNQQIAYSTICLIYEQASTTETIYPVVSHSSKTLNAGDIQVDIKNTGYADSTSGTTINTGSQIVIKSTPGYIITSVVLRSPSTDKMLNVSYLTGAEDLSVVNDELSFTITGFEAGKDYTFGNRSSTYWYVKEITITYEEHEHAPEDLTSNHDDANHWDDCICGAAVNVEAHDLVNVGEPTKLPGNGLPGEQLQTCQVCSAEVIKYLPCPITDSAITAELANQLACNGKEQAQKVTIKVGDVVLEEDVDYTLSNNLQTNAGDYTLTITGIGKYNGERTLDFTIEKGIIARPMSDSSYPEYDGSAQSYWIKPDNTRYTISGNKQTEVGTYVAEVTLKEEAYANYRWEETTERTITYTFEITKGKVNVPTEDSTIFTYNGQPLTYKLATNSRYTIDGDSRTQTNAGTYTITVSLNDPDNYQWKDGTEDDLTYSFVIAKATYDMSAISMADKTVTYDGNTHSLAIEGTLPDGVSVSYEDNGKTDAGEYTVTAIFTGNANYNAITPKTATLTIEKATYDMSGVVFEDRTVTYNGMAFSLEATNLPTGVTVSYENNGKTDAGVYTVTANFVGNANYNDIAPMTATLTIEQVVVTAPTADSKTFTYNGQPQTYALQTNSLYTISNTTFTNAGNYTITVALVNKTNYKWNNGNSNDLTYSFVIAKATYDMSGVVFANRTVTYNGTAFSLEATNLPIDVTVSYENNGKTDVGVYTVTATFTGNANYNAIAPKTATLTIEKATYDMSGVVFANRTVTYNGTAFSIEATNLPTGVTVSYENNGKTDVGEYTITAIFTGNANYNAIANKTATLTINKATYDMSGVVFTNKTVTYNGNAFSIDATNLPTGVTVAYENNGKTDVGEYTITAIFTGNANYNAIANKTATLTINKATYDMSGVVFANKTVTYNGSAFSIDATNLPTGVTASYENNGKTEAGVYTIIAKFTGNGNYNEIPNKTATLTINKAVVTAPTADTTVFTYNGQAQTYALQANNLYTISTATYTNAGAYPITVELNDKANYEWADGTIADLTFSFVIGKATYDMSGVVFADKTVTYNGSAFSIEATNLPSGVTASYENNGKMEAGEYVVTAIFTGNANYNAIANKTATLTINKATYDMSGVVFADKTVTYNGNAFSIEATNLPSGVTASYENNGKTEAGVYTIIAKFTGNENYNAISDMTATLTIKNALLVFNTNTENQIANDVMISSPDGIDPTKELVVEEVKEAENYNEFINKTQKVAIAYDIKLLKDGATVQPDGTLQFRVLIPEELRGKDFSIIHIHNGNEKSVIEYQIDGDYVVFESNKLSDFVFVYDMGSILWVIILLGVIALFEIAFLMYLLKKNKKFKSKKLMSAYPPFLFGMFIAEWQIVLVIALAVVVIALAIVSIIFAMKVINSKTKTSDDEVSVAEETDSTQSVIEVEDEVDEKDGRTVKSFLDRLDSCPSETIEYYNAIKNELLSYKNVKSKISFKHESFRLGKKILAKLKFRGKTLCLYLALNPKDYKDTKYKIEDASNVFSNNYVPTMYKINRPRRSKYAKELIDELMKKDSVEKID